MTQTTRATPPEGHGGADRDDTALHQFVHDWARAIAANDVERMASFVSDDWILVDVGGQITADTFHSLVQDGTLRHDTMVHDIIGVRYLSDDIAIVTTRCQNTGSYQGQPISADEWTTDIVVRTSNGWRCVLTQLTPRRSAAQS